jgi:hypothetical protein
MRLFLVGDDDALDVLAELSRHLDYFEVSRSDELPDALGASDHVVVGRADGRGGEWLASRFGRAALAGLAYVLDPPARGSPGARAILAAAELVKATRPVERSTD